MDTYSKMDGAAPVSSALDGVWDIQKRGVIKDQKNGKGKKGRDKKEEEKAFEDGFVPNEEDVKAETGTGPEPGENKSSEENSPKQRKIDIII